MIVSQQATKPLAALDLADDPADFLTGLRNAVLQPRVVVLCAMVHRWQRRAAGGRDADDSTFEQEDVAVATAALVALPEMVA